MVFLWHPVIFMLPRNSNCSFKKEHINKIYTKFSIFEHQNQTFWSIFNLPHPLIQNCYIHSKKKKYFTEPQKRFGRCRKASKCIQRVKKRIKKFYETLKGSSRVTKGRTFFLRNLFKFRTAKKRFRRKVRNLLSFVLNLMVSSENPLRNFKDFVLFYETFFLLYGT
jgi:hypothetical protein